ncbi:MAG: hypothetical protein ACPGUD_09775 [Parashewanella sp.]
MKHIERRRFEFYFIIFSIFLSVVGFSYNVWRLEATEMNSTVRTASFEMLKELAQLEQLTYTLHYDQNEQEASPRKGWVKVGLIQDLSPLASSEVSHKAKMLKQTWANNWQEIKTSRAATDNVVTAIENTREQIDLTLNDLH